MGRRVLYDGVAVRQTDVVPEARDGPDEGVAEPGSRADDERMPQEDQQQLQGCGPTGDAGRARQQNVGELAGESPGLGGGCGGHDGGLSGGGGLGARG